MDVMRSVAVAIQAANVLLFHSLQNFRKGGARRWLAAGPTPPGNADGCETKGLMGKAIRIVMKTKGDGKWRVVSDEWREKAGRAGDMDGTEGPLGAWSN
jgi:hypothetical protein